MFAELDQEIGTDIHVERTHESIKFQDFANAREQEVSQCSSD